MKLEFTEFARVELDNAAAYYNEQRSGLGDDFLDAVKTVTDRILADPTSWPSFSRNSRMCRAKRFPYGVVYQIHGEHVRIVAVMHLHRRPGYWHDRLQD